MKHLINEIAVRLEEAARSEAETALLASSKSARVAALKKAKTAKDQFAGKPHGIVKGIGKMTKDQHTKYYSGYEYTPISESNSGTDTVELSVPLFIRCLEWAREDAKDDVEVHKFVENIIAKDRTLTIDDYDSVLP